MIFSDEVLCNLAIALMVLGAALSVWLCIIIIINILKLIKKFIDWYIKLIIMYKAKLFWSLFSASVVFGTLTYVFEIEFLVYLYWPAFAGTILMVLLSFIFGTVRSYQNKDYPIAIAGTVAIAAVVGWAVWLIISIWKQ